MRLDLVVLTAVLLGLGVAVYNVSDNVQEKEKRIARLDSKIASQEEALRILGAEWTLLTDPSRLEKIASKHFGLEPMDGRQYIALSAVPMRTEMVEAEPAELASIAPSAPAVAMPPAMSITRVSARGVR